ncbi:hypothetical protein CVT25_005325 [Psilocybe cyanescens]|uniref:Uncharacterized protein n=1 Tax=Psilocybe cyanescens TaxID=93625 RepID=A0A409VPY1_PSICY|nr:hypothetical protein CVT25_005325 [Psilocybe cyanescens]
MSETREWAEDGLKMRVWRVPPNCVIKFQWESLTIIKSSFRNHRVVVASLLLPTTAVLLKSSPPTPEKHSRETITQVQAWVDAENTIPDVSYRLAALIAGSPPADSTV